MSSGMGVRGSHIPGAAGAVDPAKRPQPRKTPQGTPIQKARQPAGTKTTVKPKGGKMR